MARRERSPRSAVLLLAVVGVTVALTLCTRSATAQRESPALEAELEGRVVAILGSFPIPGLAVGVVLGDTLACVRGFGVADREAGVAVEPGTLFQIGSVSTSLTATLAGILEHRGENSLGKAGPAARDDHLAVHPGAGAPPCGEELMCRTRRRQGGRRPPPPRGAPNVPGGRPARSWTPPRSLSRVAAASARQERAAAVATRALDPRSRR